MRNLIWYIKAMLSVDYLCGLFIGGSVKQLPVQCPVSISFNKMRDWQDILQKVKGVNSTKAQIGDFSLVLNGSNTFCRPPFATIFVV
jgi:hypothetical protein